MLSGTVDFSGEKTGAVYMSSGTDAFLQRVVPLVAQNAVDGLIVGTGK